MTPDCMGDRVCMDETSLEPELSSDLRDTETDVGRDRLVRVFGFLEALSQQRSPVKRLLTDQPWSMHLRHLPDHKAIQRRTVLPDRSVQDINPVILQVQRPKLTNAPAPSESIVDWIERGWEDPSSAVCTRQSKNETNAEGQSIIIRFEDDPRRPKDLALGSCSAMNG